MAFSLQLLNIALERAAGTQNGPITSTHTHVRMLLVLKWWIQIHATYTYNMKMECVFSLLPLLLPLAQGIGDSGYRLHWVENFIHCMAWTAKTFNWILFSAHSFFPSIIYSGFFFSYTCSLFCSTLLFPRWSHRHWHVYYECASGMDTFEFNSKNHIPMCNAFNICIYIWHYTQWSF